MEENTSKRSRAKKDTRTEFEKSIFEVTLDKMILGEKDEETGKSEKISKEVKVKFFRSTWMAFLESGKHTGNYIIDAKNVPSDLPKSFKEYDKKYLKEEEFKAKYPKG